MQKFNFGKTFLLGFGFFGVSVIWSVYNAFVPVFLQDRFLMAPAFIGFFMTLDNIAALFIQPAVGAWSDRMRTRIGRRLPFILIGAPIAALAFFFLPFAKALPLFFMAALAAPEHGDLAHAHCRLDAGCHPVQISVAGKRDHQFHGWSRDCYCLRLVLAGGQLVHHGGQPGRVVADRLVDHEQRPGAALGDQAADVLEAGDEARGLRALPLAREALGAAGVRILPGERLDLAGAGGQLRHRRVATLLQQRHAELLQHRLDAPGVVDGGLVVVAVAVAVPGPGREVDRVPGLPFHAHAVDLGPAGAGLDEHDGVPAVPVDGGALETGGQLVDGGVQVLGRAVAVPARVDAAPAAPDRVVVHRHVGALEHRLVVAPPLLQERLAALLLDLVVGDLGGRRGLHACPPGRTGFTAGRGRRGGPARDGDRPRSADQPTATAPPPTFGKTSSARIVICSFQSGKRIRKSKMSRSAPISW